MGLTHKSKRYKKQYEILRSRPFRRRCCRQKSPTTTPSSTFECVEPIHRGNVEHLVHLPPIKGQLDPKVPKQRRPYGTCFHSWRTAMVTMMKHNSHMVVQLNVSDVRTKKETPHGIVTTVKIHLSVPNNLPPDTENGPNDTSPNALDNDFTATRSTV